MIVTIVVVVVIIVLRRVISLDVGRKRVRHAVLNEILYDGRGPYPMIILPPLSFVVVFIITSSYIASMTGVVIPVVIVIPGVFPPVPFTVVRHVGGGGNESCVGAKLALTSS